MSQHLEHAQEQQFLTLADEQKTAQIFWSSAILIFSFIAVLGMSFIIPYFGVAFFLLISLVQGFYEVILGDYVNKHVESSHRATMLSINNIFDNMGIFLIFPILGYLNRVYNISISLFSLSIFLLISSLILIIFYKNNNSKKDLRKT